jgi:hypothetical protein
LLRSLPTEPSATDEPKDLNKRASHSQLVCNNWFDPIPLGSEIMFSIDTESGLDKISFDTTPISSR